jgi:hypothetical protein
MEIIASGLLVMVYAAPYQYLAERLFGPNTNTKTLSYIETSSPGIIAF